MSDLKSFLHEWCNKNRLEPMFEVRPTGPKHRQRFLCELRVSTFPYTAVGNSTNKKDSEKNASKDFVNYLVRNGKIARNEIPIDALDGNIGSVGGDGESNITIAAQISNIPALMRGSDHPTNAHVFRVICCFIFYIFILLYIILFMFTYKFRKD